MRTVRVRRGTPFTVIKVKGRGGPPHVVVRGPGGFVARGNATTGSGKPSRWLIMPDPDSKTTTISLDRPRAGSYRIALASGSPAVAAISRASGLPDPKVRGRLIGKGRARVLDFRVRPIAGQVVEFREQGTAGDRLILKTRRREGRVRFRVVDGPAGRRSIVANVMQRGNLRAVVPVTAYTAPTARSAKPVRKLVLKRQDGAVRATWRATGDPPTRYRVTAELSDGRRVLVSPVAGNMRASRSTKARIADVPAGVDVTFRVAALNVLGLSSQARTASTATLRIARTTARVASGKARVKVVCLAAASQCAGKLVLRAASGKASQLGSKTFTIRNGSEATVVVPLNAAGRRATSRQRRAPVLAYVGATTRTEVTLVR